MSHRVFHKHQVCYHLYADDKQAYVSVPVSDISLASYSLQNCISDISSWCSSRRLQLNVTELIWFGSRQMISKLSDCDLPLDIDTIVIHPAQSVCDLVSWEWRLTSQGWSACVSFNCAKFATFAGLSDKTYHTDTASDISFCTVATWLLQLSISLSSISQAIVNQQLTAATCDECCSMSCDGSVNSQPCKTSIKTTSLASSCIQNNVQTMPVQALCLYWLHPTISDKQCQQAFCI